MPLVSPGGEHDGIYESLTTNSLEPTGARTWLCAQVFKPVPVLALVEPNRWPSAEKKIKEDAHPKKISNPTLLGHEATILNDGRPLTATMEAKKVLLILGAGPNVATSTADLFAGHGYKIAVVSRGRTAFPPSYLHIQSDLSQAGSVQAAFAQVKEAYGSPPNVVIHNAYHVFPAEKDNPLTLSEAQLNHDLAVNVASAYLAAGQAVKGFEILPDDELLPKSFLYTANGLNAMPQPRLVSLGLGKTAMAHVIETCVLAFKGKGWTFYYEDERLPEGDFAAAAISGPAHAARYWQLSQDRRQHACIDTFVADQGYKKF